MTTKQTEKAAPGAHPELDGCDRSGSEVDHRRRLLAGIPVTERRLELAGISTTALVGGEGPPIVLLHGPGESGVNWRWVIPDLVRTHRVIAPDLPGHGTTEGPDDALDADRVLAWLGELIERTCDSAPTLVGHVLGGAIGARFAIANGGRLNHLVLVDSLGVARFRPAPRFAFGLAAFVTRPSERRYDRFMRQCSYDLNSLRERMGEEWEQFAAYNITLARAPQAKAGGKLMRRLGIPRIPAEELGRIRVPTTLIWGRHDRANRLRVAETASERYGWPLLVIDEAADDPIRDQPQAFLRALRAVLAQPDSRLRGRSAAPNVLSKKATRSLEKEDAMPTIRETQTMNYEVAETLAPTWAKRRPQIEQVTAPVREWLVVELAPSEGDVILELAAGVGDTGFDAAELIGDEGKLISSDFSPRMLEEARRRGAERGVRNAEYQVIDAERIALDDDSVDGVLCRYGYMLMAGTAAALAETRRVLRPGGRLALAVWGPPERNPFFSILGGTLVEGGHVPPPEPPPAPGIFAMGSEERTALLLEAAGFGEVRIAEVEVRFPVPSVREYLEFTADTAGPIAIALRGLSAEDRETLEPELEEAFAPFATGDGYDLRGVTLCALAK